MVSRLQCVNNLEVRSNSIYNLDYLDFSQIIRKGLILATLHGFVVNGIENEIKLSEVKVTELW